MFGNLSFGCWMCAGCVLDVLLLEVNQARIRRCGLYSLNFIFAKIFMLIFTDACGFFTALVILIFSQIE